MTGLFKWLLVHVGNTCSCAVVGFVCDIVCGTFCVVVLSAATQLSGVLCCMDAFTQCINALFAPKSQPGCSVAPSGSNILTSSDFNVLTPWATTGNVTARVQVGTTHFVAANPRLWPLPVVGPPPRLCCCVLLRLGC
jgi:hypothetical protein